MSVAKIQKIHPDAVIPSYAHQGDSGMDVYAVEDALIPAHERKLIPLGFKISIPRFTEIQVRPKSGLALNHGLTVLNTPGTVDSNYRGEVGVVLFNTSNEDYLVKKGSKVAQIVLCPVFNVDEWTEVDDLEDSNRGEGGFGSTGV
jgi:dUTP pyrophosphatase